MHTLMGQVVPGVLTAVAIYFLMLAAREGGRIVQLKRSRKRA